MRAGADLTLVRDEYAGMRATDFSIEARVAFMQRLPDCRPFRHGSSEPSVNRTDLAMTTSPSTLRLLAIYLMAIAAALVAGCQTAGPPAAAVLALQESAKPDVIVLREGDLVRIAFPGTPSLDDAQQIRRDGKLALKQGGEVVAAGKSLAELEKEILKIYDAQLVVKQVSVTLGTSAYPLFVIGAVLRPGKIMADRPLTVFEALMEAGGPDFAKANMKEVLLLRQGPEGLATFKFNLKAALQGHGSPESYVKPSDVIYVREKFSWF